jgi:hypothetical protein
MDQSQKQIIKYYLPPILLDKLKNLFSIFNFLKYQKIIAANIELKDIHKGKRCFILGSGPSIQKEDLKPLKDEIVFALNNFYVHEDFKIVMSGSIQKYYMTAPIHPPQIEAEWKNWFEDMEKNIPQNINMIFGLNKNKINIKYILDKYQLFKDHKINWYYAGITTSEYSKFNLNEINITNMIWSAGTVSIYALIMAIYMGFDEIYLLGMDHSQICNTNKDNIRFYKKATFQEKETPLNISENKYTQVQQYKGRLIQWNQYYMLEKYTIPKIKNLSDGSLLQIFERDTLKDIINGC